MESSSKFIYTVTMYKWGDKENRSYILGVFDDMLLSIIEMLKEELMRGGKYTGEILEFKVNNCVPERIIVNCNRIP